MLRLLLLLSLPTAGRPPAEAAHLADDVAEALRLPVEHLVLAARLRRRDQEHCVRLGLRARARKIGKY